jgi:hypothetical protein
MEVFETKILHALDRIEKAIRAAGEKIEESEQPIPAHICNKRDLKPYHAVACSICENRDDAIEILIDGENYKKLEEFLAALP